ncbi:MAG: AMP-binding protein [Pseudomonadota bacterium]
MTIIESRMPAVPVTDQSITERLFAGLEGDPERVVLTDGVTGYSLTASRLRDRICRLAGGLIGMGLGKGGTTALMAPNMPDYVTVFHGVAWAGGTITTINPTYTAEELRHQLSDSGATLLVTIAQFLDTARAGAEGTSVSEIVVIDEADGVRSLDDLMGDPLAEQAPVDIERDIVALPYSSGTTGLSKGVMLTHRNLVVNVDQGLPMTNIAPGDTTIAFLPLFHIYGLTVLMNMYLAHGAALVTMPRFDLERFLQLIQEHRTRTLWCVPPVGIALAKSPIVDDYDLSSVELFYSAAAPLGPELSDAVARRLNVNAIQAYGMTEMSPISHATLPDAPKAGSCGLTVPNTACRIVNPETGEDCPIGTEGELWVKGPQVMVGYLNNPEATAATVTEDGWLKTGDLASFDSDGYLFIHDRLKELIKVKGFQVAPAELEAVILTHPDVADVAVVGQPDDEAGERPVAHVVCNPNATPTKDAIKAHVLDHVSHYKELAEVHFTDAIPKSASGKILRRLLRSNSA